MNWLGVIILAIPVLYIFSGFQKGMVKMAFSFLSIFITLAACFILNTYIEKMLKQETRIYENIQNECVSYMKETIEIQDSTEEQKNIIQNLPLPEDITKLLFAENTDKENGDILAEGFIKSLSGYITDFIIGAISLILTFLLVSIVMGAAGKILGTIFSFPVLSLMNRIGGAALGAVKGICIIWIFFLVIGAFWNTAWAQNFYHLIRENTITGYLYDQNIFLYFLKGIIK